MKKKLTKKESAYKQFVGDFKQCEHCKPLISLK